MHPDWQIYLILTIGGLIEVNLFVKRLMKLQNQFPFEYWAGGKKDKGMSIWYDLIDWGGGYPSEVAKPEEVFNLCSDREYVLEHLKPWGILGP